MLEELPHLTSALADERDHDHVRVGAADDVGQQGRLTASGFAENPDALSARAGEKTIDGTDAKLNWIANDAATERRRRHCGDRTRRNVLRKRVPSDPIPHSLEGAAR